MEDGLLSLKWNNHKSTFFHILSNLRKRETYTDATLACEGKFFPVHKLVLSSCSDYFSEVFERTNCKSPVVILKDISHSDIEALLDYMYLGEVDVKQSELAALIKAAECLRIKGLAVPDEDPSGMQKKNKASAECRSSPSAKRIRRSSGGNDSSHSKYKSVSSINSSRSQTSTSVISTLVPSQLGNTDSLSRGPVDPIPDSSFIGSSNSQSDLSSSISDRVRSEQSSGPVQIVKLEVEDGISNSDYPNSSLERAAVGNKRDSGITSGNELQGTSTVHNDFDTYSSSSIVIEKEEHEQIESYNGSDQIPGPSGVQATSQILNWNEEDGSFPHNIFGQEESSQQQVLGAFYEELLSDQSPLQQSGRNLASELSKVPIDYKYLKNVPADIQAAIVTASAVALQKGQTILKCPLCSKTSKRRDHLRLHIRTHTGERPYHCSFCPHKACQKSDLDKHMKTHLKNLRGSEQ